MRIPSRSFRHVLGAAVVAAFLALAGAATAGTTPGTNGKDAIDGTPRADELNGRGGSDTIAGGRGKDTITGGKGQDVLAGGRGNDRINARDGQADVVTCGAGKDVVRADGKDVVSPDCERENLPGEPLPVHKLAIVVEAHGPYDGAVGVHVAHDRGPQTGMCTPQNSPCFYTVSPGTGDTFYLTLRPSGARAWDGWGDDCAGVREPTCTVTVFRDDRIASASWNPA